MTLFNRHWSRYFKKWNYAAFVLWGLSLFLLDSFKIHPLCSMNLTCSGASLVLAEYLPKHILYIAKKLVLILSNDCFGH